MTDRDETIRQLRRHGIVVTRPEGFDVDVFEAEGRAFAVHGDGAILRFCHGEAGDRWSRSDLPDVDLTERPHTYDMPCSTGGTQLTDDLWAVTVDEGYTILRNIMRACCDWRLDVDAAAKVLRRKPEADAFNEAHYCNLGDWLARYNVAPAVMNRPNASGETVYATLRVRNLTVVVEDREQGETVELEADMRAIDSLAP